MKPLILVWLSFFVLGGLSGQEAPLTSPVLDPGPGTYSSAVKLDLRVPEGASVRYRFLDTASPQTFPWSPLVLDALTGETRVYTLRLTTVFSSGEAVTRDYRYIIAPPVPALAAVRPAPGFYTSDVTVQASLPEGWTVRQSGLPVAFPLFLDAAPGDRRDFLLEAQGPRGGSLSWSYTVDRRDQENVALDLLSPLPGTWANSQPLVVDFKGMDQVFWSYGDHLDRASAQAYKGLVTLDRTGAQTLTVAGHSRIDGRWIEKTVAWTTGSDPLPAADWPLSGVSVSGLTWPAVPGWSVSWDEGRSWQAEPPARREDSSSVFRKVLTVQVRKEGLVSRFVYWLDARPPRAPEVQFVGGWNPRVVFSGSTEALHRVVWTLADGKTLEEASALWGPLGSWKVPDRVVAARVEVQSVNGLSGPPASVSFAQTGWSTPEWEPWDQKGPQSDRSQWPLGGRVIPRPGFWPVYEVSDQPSVAEPGPQSPVLEGAFLPAVPRGADRSFYVRFAWRDAGGLVGPSTEVLSIRVDRIPPLAPDVSVVGGTILIKPAEGEKDGISLLWAVTPDRVSSAESLTFQQYTSALDAAALRTGPGKSLWLHAMAQDSEGNSGPARLNVALPSSSADSGEGVVQVDPDPAVGETVVEEGGVYSWPAFHLRAFEQRTDLWVGVSDQTSGLPEDWKARLQPWSGLFSRTLGKGERRTFLVFWNAKNSSGWVWTQPKTLSFTLDQGVPAAPVLIGSWPDTPLAAGWTLKLQPGRPGDSLRYTFTVDGSLPGDPVTAGTPWGGSRTWEAPPGGQIIVRVRAASVAVSGLAVEMPQREPVTIDRRPPASVVPALDPFTYRTEGLTVPLPAGAGLVRYTLSTDGSLPEVPTSESSALPSTGFVLEGKAGQSVLYRFRWRPYSLAGLPGPATDPFAVLVDRTSAEAPASSSSLPEGSASAPLVTGLPSSGVSAAAVTLGAHWPQGVLRFEVREGVGQPRSVTPESPVWDRPLVLDGGEGTDRSYVVSVRGFSPEGSPLTAETRYSVRVDRSIPQAPDFDLVADSRRPEAILKSHPSEQSPDETLYYRWSWEAFPQGQGQIDWTPVDSNPPRFSAPGGALTVLHVEAYLKDEAGNQSPPSERSLLIDQNVVYVSAQGTGDGTRGNPLGSVTQAVEKMRREGKAILFVAAGSFTVAKTLDLQGFQVFGGWNPSLWEKTSDPGRSVWTTTAPFTGASMLESGDRPWTLCRVDLTSSAVPLSRLVVVRGARVEVSDSVWSVAGVDVGWDQVGGSLSGNNVTASYAAQPKGNLLALQSVEVSFRGLSVDETLNRDGVLLDFLDCQALFQNLAVVSKKASGFDGVWTARGSWLTVDGARISAGEGADRVSAFVFKDTEATFWNSEVDLYGQLSNTGFQTTGGRLELQKTELNLLRGEEFNQGFVLDHTDAVLRTFQLKVDHGAYQGGFTVDGGTLTFASGKVQLAGGGQRVWGARFEETCTVGLQDVDWLLSSKTPGDLWKMDKPWAQGSTVAGSTTAGW